jgi:hypothetical protein
MSKMQIDWNLASVFGALAVIGLIPTGSAAQTTPPGLHTDPLENPATAVLTYHNDNARTGQFTLETALTPSTVYTANFGKLFTQSVDGYIYAQPLYAPGIMIPGNGTHNVVYVATEHDSVYAFDADSSSGGTLWKTSFINSSAGVTTVPSADVGVNDIVPEIGITATPVIDYVASTIFVEVKTKEVVGGVTNYVHRLHALDIRTGLEKPNSPVVITAISEGTGDGNNGKGQVPWNPLRQHVRPALLLNYGVVYVASASHGDIGPYHGWVLAYNEDTLQQLYTINLTPNGGLGGVWQAGNGMVADTLGIMYCATGNGTFDADPSLGNGIDYGDSFVRLAPVAGKLQVQDYFTPFDQAYLDAVDGDLGSGGVLIPPTQTGKYPNILIGCGKEGRIYVVNRDNMSHFHAATDEVIQTISNANGGTWSSPAYWNNNIYYNAQGDVLKCYSLIGGLLSTTPTSKSNVTLGFPGATPSISSNGATGGIVWIVQTDAYGTPGPAILHAFDATNVAHELWNSTLAGTRDTAGNAVKFATPTISNGKVYIGTATELDVYGIL